VSEDVLARLAGQGGRIIGREEELRRIHQALDEAGARGRSLGMVGNPGTGKSALLAGTATDARRRGFTVLAARGTEAAAQRRFGVLQQLLAPAADRIGSLPVRYQAALRGALGDGGDAAERFFIALGVLELFGDLGARSPLLVVVDDLHWADSDSREVVLFAARRVEAERAVMLLAARPSPDGHWPWERDTDWLALGALGTTAAREVLRDRYPWLAAADERTVLASADGNPLALVELPLALAAARFAGRPADDPVPLTGRLEGSFADQIAALGVAEQTALLVAALQDSDTLTETLAALAELTGDDQGSARIDAAIAAGLVRSDGTSVRFRHPLVRSAVVGRAPAAQRRAVHLAFARSLAADPDRATWHRALAARDPDDELAAALEAGAERTAASGAAGLAEEWLERAAQLSGDETGKARRLLRAAELAFQLGRADAVHELMAAARALPLDAPTYARLAGLEGAFDDGVPGDIGTVRRLVEAAESALAVGEQDLAASLLLGAAMPCYWGAAGDLVRDLVGGAARSLTVPADDPRVMAVNALVDPFGSGGDVVAALSRWGRRDTRDPALASALGRAGFVAGDFEHGLLFAQQASEGLRREGRVALLTQALVLQTFSALYLGRWEITHVASDEAYRFAVETRQPVWAACAQLGRANLAGLHGDHERAVSLSGEVERYALGAGNRSLLNGVQLARGFAALGDGRPGDAFAELRRMMDPADLAYQAPQCAWAVDYLAEAAALSGQHALGSDMLAAVEELAGATTAPGVRRAIALARAFLAPDEVAEERFAQARECAADAPAWFGARLDLAYGSWQRGQHRAAQAREPLRAALAAFDSLGASAWAARAQAELAAAGHRALRRGAGGWTQLSAIELQVAQLAARGLSNREIGMRLYLSHRTVAAHLYRIFPKLGIGSRSELPGVLPEELPQQRLSGR
jgi:DNA-binding CsgD family transcriptional regulator